MRIITGDECGLLKEVIPELSRPTPTNTASSSSSSASIHSGNARPSATSIQAAAAAQMMQQFGGGLISSSSAVRKIEESEGQSRQRGVVSMAFAALTDDDGAMEDDTSSADFHFATLRMNGVVQLWMGSRSRGNDEGHVTPAAYKQIGLCQNVLQDVTTTSDGNKRRSEENENDASSSFVDGNNTSPSSTNNSDSAVTGWNAHQPIRPIAMVSSRKYDTTNSSSNSNNPILACADSMGNISLLNSNNLQKGIVSTYNAYDLSTNQIINAQSKDNRKSTTSNNAVLTYTKGRYANTAICTALELCSGGEQLAVGGRERGVRVLDLESGKLIWKAKNLPPDPQTLLQQPQWTTCIQSITMDGSSNFLATGTAYKQVQIYDIRTSSTTRRPVLYTPEHLFTHRITTICQLHNNTNNTTLLAIGDSTGDCHLVDMRMMHSGKQYSARKQSAKEEIGLGRLVGPGGSIRELVVHPTLPYLACVGLDRKLWTWDVNKRKMMDCVYLKQRLNCALFCGDDSWSDGGGGGDNNDDDVGDDYGEVDYVPDEEWNSKRERELEEDQDEVKDYIDSDDDNEGGDAQEDSGETASDSEEVDSSEGGSSSSNSSEEEDEEPTHKRGKRQKR